MNSVHVAEERTPAAAARISSCVLVVVNAAGVETSGFPIKVVSPVLRIRVSQPAVGDDTVTLDLLDQGKLLDPVKVKIAEITQDAFWDNKSSKLTIPIPPNVEGVVPLTATASGASFSTQIVVASG